MIAAAAFVEDPPRPGFIWRPNPGPQTQFLACSADECLYGGAAGGGKTDGMIACPTRWLQHPKFRALILRRTLPELKQSIFDRAFEFYKAIDPGADFNKTENQWTFSTGAKLFFGHAEHEDSVHRYQGSAFQLIGFEELTHFTRAQYLYLFTRARSAYGLPIRIRATANPGGEGHEWVFERWAPWLNKRPNYTGPRAASGEILYFVPGRSPEDPERYLPGGRTEADELLARWALLSDDEKSATPRPVSRTFIAAKLSDNPELIKNDPGYADRIRMQDAVTRRQLLDGDWLATAAPGAYYRRGWFRFLDVKPAVVAARVRRWDLASTEDGGDWTVGVRMALLQDRSFVVEDVVRARLRPAGVAALVLATAELDGKACHISFAQDPGQAGKAQVEAYVRMLAGWVVRAEPETGDKTTRQAPFSAQCEANNVAIVRGAWNEPFLQTLEAFPTKGVHDDDVDAGGGAFTYLTKRLGALSYVKAMQVIANEKA